MSKPLKEQILEQINNLSLEHQQRLLDFARQLVKSAPVAVPGEKLLHFAGTIEADDLRGMTQAIEDSCERIDLNEW